MSEITWSLMHPTPLNVEYMKKVVANAPRYRVDSFEICAKCHSNLGGLDGLTDYTGFPVTGQRFDTEGVVQNRKVLKEILALAHSINKPVYYWHREAMVPDGLLEDRPGLLDSDGEFDLLGEEYANLLRHKIDSSFTNVPELDGLVLTLTEATYSVIHNSNMEKYPPKKVVAHIVEIFASELAKRGKRFVLRSFGSIAQDYEDIIDGAREVAKKYSFEIETKITPYDFDPFLPVNPFLHTVPGATLGAECDCLGEFLGAGVMPAENVENIVQYVRAGQAAGVNRYAIRIDRVGNNVFDRYEINLYAYARAIDDPTVTAEDIRREYLEKTAPASAREVFDHIGREGFRMISKNYFIDGHVIFHTFPVRNDLKYLKAAYIFAVFKNGVSLKNGRGVWSILAEKDTPGRAAILAEKDEAVAIAERCKAMLDALPVEPGYEKEYEWRKKLWSNAVQVTRGLREFIRCIIAYFDDMEKGDPDCTGLKKVGAEARAVLQSIADNNLEGDNEKPKFVNGMDSSRNLFKPLTSMDDIYLRRFFNVSQLLVEEYGCEFAARQEFGKESVDCIICGSLLDEWRVARYMHSAHSDTVNGYQFRWAGNTVFPNGTLEMELAAPAAGGEVVIYGDISETDKFICSIDGSPRKQYSFDADGVCRIALAGGKEKITVVLAKAPGVYYPRFRAVVTKAK